MNHSTPYASNAMQSATDSYLIADKVEYITIVISEFARKHRLTTQQAYLYLKRHRGIEFLNKGYDVEHLFSIEDVVDDVSDYCQQQANIPL
jgi:hypothetical protein